MPYVTRDARKRLAMGGTPETAGELNYIVTMALKPLYPRFMGYLILKGMSYQTFNDMFGAVTGALIEFIPNLKPGDKMKIGSVVGGDRIAVLDALMIQTDRLSVNWGEASGRAWALDNGLGEGMFGVGF